MSLEILAKLRELADKGISDVKEAIGYLEKEAETVEAEIVAAVEPAPEVAPVTETTVEPVAPAVEAPISAPAPSEQLAEQPAA